MEKVFFFFFLNVPFVVQKNPYSERIADLTCDLALLFESNLCSKPRKEQNFATRLLRAALERANAADKAVRLQVLRFAWKMLKAFDGVQVDEGFSVYVRDRVILLLQSGAVDQRVLAAQVFSLVAQLEDDEDTIAAVQLALEDACSDVRLEMLKMLEHSSSDWQELAGDVAVCARQDSEPSIRRLAFQALSVPKAKEWAEDMLLDLVVSASVDPEKSVREACGMMLNRRWKGLDIAEKLEQLTQNKSEQDAAIALLMQGGLVLPAKFFRDKIDSLTPVAARLWLAYLDNATQDMRELLLPSVAAYAAALDYYSSQNDQFIALCAMLPIYDSSQFEGHREQLSEIFRKVILVGDDAVSENVLEASLDALKILHSETRDWVHVCLEIVVDLIDEDARDEEQLRWSSALLVAHNVLQDSRVSLNQAGMQELLHNVLLRGVAFEAAPVRALAVRALGCLCVMSFEHARTYMLLFATVLNKDLVEVQVEAMKVILDCCLLYGASLVPGLTSEALSELAEGPQCEDEPHPVLARVLAPLDARNADHKLQEIACLGLAKMLLHGRLQSYSMLGRAVAKAAEGFPMMEQFTQEFAQRAPKICLPNLRHALPFAAARLRGKQQGAALRALAKNWNVPWDSLAAQALLAGGDPIAISSMAPTGAANEMLTEAVISRHAQEKSSVLRDALARWAVDRGITIPGVGSLSLKKGRKKQASSDQDSSGFASPEPKKRGASSKTPNSASSTVVKKKAKKESGSAAVAAHMTPEMVRLKKMNQDLDTFQLDEEPLDRVVAPTPTTAVSKRSRAEINLVDDGPSNMDDEILHLREKMAKMTTPTSAVVACKQPDSSSESALLKKRLRDSEETPLRPVSAVTVLLSGFNSEQRSKLSDMVHSLGGTVSDSAAFSQRISHVVVKTLRENYSSKVLAGALKGCWIVTDQWLAESSRRKMFVDEQAFGARFSRASRPVFHKKIFFSPAFVAERKKDPSFEIAHLEALFLTSYLGDGSRCDDPAKADVILTSAAEKPTLKVKLWQKAFTYNEICEAILTQ